MSFYDIDLSFDKKIRGRIENSSEVYDIRTLSDLSAITRSLKNIILTMPGERRFDFNFGTNIYKLLFEVMPLETESEFIGHKIQEKIQLYEPRVSKVGVVINTNYEQQSIIVVISFTVVSTQKSYRVPIILQRNR